MKGGCGTLTVDWAGLKRTGGGSAFAAQNFSLTLATAEYTSKRYKLISELRASNLDGIFGRYLDVISSPAELVAMANPHLSLRLAQTWRSLNSASVCNRCLQFGRTLATNGAARQTQKDLEMEENSSLRGPQAPDPRLKDFEPLRSAKTRRRQLPPSR